MSQYYHHLPPAMLNTGPTYTTSKTVTTAMHYPAGEAPSLRQTPTPVHPFDSQDTHPVHFPHPRISGDSKSCHASRLLTQHTSQTGLTPFPRLPSDSASTLSSLTVYTAPQLHVVTRPQSMGTWDEFTPNVSPRPMRSNSVLSIDDPLPNIMVRTRRLSLTERLQLWWCGDSLPRHHWKHDVESARCDHHLCLRSFNPLIRRHHCRLCGYIFCNNCTQFTVFLDERLNFSPHHGVPARSCKSCYRRFLEESPGCFSNH